MSGRVGGLRVFSYNGAEFVMQYLFADVQAEATKLVSFGHVSFPKVDVVSIGSWTVRDAGGSRTHSKLLCRQPPYRLAPASCQCPYQESNLVLDLRRVACESNTLQGQFHSVPRRGIEPRPTDSKSAMPSITLAGQSSFQRSAVSNQLDPAVAKS